MILGRLGCLEDREGPTVDAFDPGEQGISLRYPLRLGSFREELGEMFSRMVPESIPRDPVGAGYCEICLSADQILIDLLDVRMHADCAGSTHTLPVSIGRFDYGVGPPVVLVRLPLLRFRRFGQGLRRRPFDRRLGDRRAAR